LFSDGLEGKPKSLDGSVPDDHGKRVGENIPEGAQGAGGVLLFEVNLSTQRPARLPF